MYRIVQIREYEVGLLYRSGLTFDTAKAAIAALAETTPEAAGDVAVMSDFLGQGLGPPPAWVARIPWFGDSLAADWQTVATGGPDALKALVQPYALGAAGAAVAATGGVGRTVVLALLTIILVGIFYAQGETAARGLLAFAHRLSGETGERAIILAGQAIRGVALGVVVTALVQALLAGISLWFCGIPHPGVLTAIAFILGIAQIGPLPVMAGAVGWLYWTGSTGWAIALLIWSVPLVMLDNVLRGGEVLDGANEDPRTLATREVNDRAIADERVDVAMLGVADGITLALKR